MGKNFDTFARAIGQYRPAYIDEHTSMVHHSEACGRQIQSRWV